MIFFVTEGSRATCKHKINNCLLTHQEEAVQQYSSTEHFESKKDRNKIKLTKTLLVHLVAVAAIANSTVV